MTSTLPPLSPGSFSVAGRQQPPLAGPSGPQPRPPPRRPAAPDLDGNGGRRPTEAVRAGGPMDDVGLGGDLVQLRRRRLEELRLAAEREKMHDFLHEVQGEKGAALARRSLVSARDLVSRQQVPAGKLCSGGSVTSRCSTSSRCGLRSGSRQRGHGVFRTEDGREYRGEFRDGLMHGHGVRTWSDGRRYVGQWRHDAMWGQGELSCATGEVLRGTFKANALHGLGERIWPNRDRYSGHFCEGELEGTGTFFEQATGSIFEGQWLHGRLYGEGMVTRSDGSTYSGEWVDGILDGRGRETWPDGSYYEGPFKKRCAQGKGLKVFADGAWFEGMFCDGQFEGHGVFHWADGTEFEGLWHKNQIAGVGCHRFPTGTTIIGNFQDHGVSGEGTKTWGCGCVYTGLLLRNRIHRTGTLKWPDGRCYVGAFEDDAMHGGGTLVWADAAGLCTYRGKFVNNLFEGFGLLEWSSGARYEGDFVGGLYHGEGTFQWPDGQGSYGGSWVRGEMCGGGTLHVGHLEQAAAAVASAYEYVGDFCTGHMEGKGIVTFQTNGQIDQYEGDFKASRFCGRGTFTWGTGHQLQGLFEDNYCNRVGRKTYPDQRTYTGELRYDLEHGKGVMREPGGREFVGLWRDGEVLKELIMSGAPEFDLVEDDGFAVPASGRASPEVRGSVDSQQAGGCSVNSIVLLTADASCMVHTGPCSDGGSAVVEVAEAAEAAKTVAEFRSYASEASDWAAPEESLPLALQSLDTLSIRRKHLLPVINEFGNLAEGKSLVVFLNGDRYVGHMKEGRKHGRGMYVYADLVTYSGLWDMDLLDGVRHPATEDVLPVEVRRLGPPLVAPDPDEGLDGAGMAQSMSLLSTRSQTCDITRSQTGEASSEWMEATSSMRKSLALTVVTKSSTDGSEECHSPHYNFSSPTKRRSTRPSIAFDIGGERAVH